MNTSALIDRFNRKINYIHLSVTDRCNFRCVYCMNEKTRFLPRAQILTLEELALIGKAFVELGVTRIRVTGGEPLIRKNIVQLLENLSELAGLQELTITTNGSLLANLSLQLKKAGIQRINISLDSLQPARFRQLTRFGELPIVLAGIETALQTGFERVKINTVVLKNRNHDEITALVQFAIAHEMDISFIEEMPLGIVEEHDRFQAYYSSEQIRQDLMQSFTLLPTTLTTGGPAKYYWVANTQTRVGFISPHSHNFCDICNRVRVTTSGRLLLCLGHEEGIDLRQVIRTHPGEIEPLKMAIVHAIANKPFKHEFDFAQPLALRYMNMTGG